MLKRHAKIIRDPNKAGLPDRFVMVSGTGRTVLNSDGKTLELHCDQAHELFGDQLPGFNEAKGDAAVEAMLKNPPEQPKRRAEVPRRERNKQTGEFLEVEEAVMRAKIEGEIAVDREKGREAIEVKTKKLEADRKAFEAEREKVEKQQENAGAAK